MKKITTAILIVNWLIIIGSVTSIFLMQCDVITVIDGVEGPTEVFLEDETTNVGMIPPILLAVVLLVNSFVIRQQNKIIANHH